jgi:tetratricopeptide (TPR) repeat protein
VARAHEKFLPASRLPPAVHRQAGAATIRRGGRTQDDGRPVTPEIGATLARAAGHWNAGQADQAEMACQQVLAVWPGQSDAMHLLGLMAHAFGNLDLAVAHMRKACEAPRAPAVYFSTLAEICRQAGLPAEGERAARRAVTLDPQQAGAWNNLGILLQEQGRFEEGRHCLLRTLALAPDDPQAHNNLGNTCRHLGLLGEAERHWTRAIALAPDYAEPHSNLANLLTSQAEFDRAAALARRAIELSPQMADAYLNLAGVEVARQRMAEALRWLQALLAFAPDHARGLAALALVLRDLDRLEEALAAAQRAVALSPESADAQVALGRVLQADGQYDAALACFGRAATLPGTAREKALVDQAVLHMCFGHKDRAEAVFDTVLAEFPCSATAWFNRVDLRTVVAGDPSLPRLLALLDGPSATGATLSRHDRMLLSFAAGKALLDIGESEAAFRHLDAGNRMKRALIGHDPEATAQWLRGIAEIFSAGLLDSMGGSGAAAAIPVFIVGMPRSGTTLVEQILASHPDIRGAGELPYMQRLIDQTGAWPEAVAGLDAARLAAMGQAYLARIAPLAGGRRHVIDKMPSNFLHAGLIRLILPEARIIHCRRDPVDTCLSCYSKLFSAEQHFTYDLAELGQFHRGYQALMAHWRAVLPPTHFIEVDYESVVADLAGETRRLLDFLGLPWNDSCRDFHRTARPILTASVNQVREPLHARSVGRWRRHAAQLAPLLEALEIAA